MVGLGLAAYRHSRTAWEPQGSRFCIVPSLSFPLSVILALRDQTLNVNSERDLLLLRVRSPRIRDELVTAGQEKIVATLRGHHVAVEHLRAPRSWGGAPLTLRDWHRYVHLHVPPAPLWASCRLIVGLWSVLLTEAIFQPRRAAARWTCTMNAACLHAATGDSMVDAAPCMC